MERYLQELKVFNIGPVISEQHRAKGPFIHRIGKSKKVDHFAGGNVPDKPGSWIEPTVISGLSHTSRTATEEIFGPVVTVHKFDTEEEAIENGKLHPVWFSR